MMQKCRARKECAGSGFSSANGQANHVDDPLMHSMQRVHKHCPRLFLTTTARLAGFADAVRNRLRSPCNKPTLLARTNT